MQISIFLCIILVSCFSGGDICLPNRIFIVEDDFAIARILTQELEAWGYESVQASDFYQVLEDFKKIDPSLVLLDLSLPYRSGFYWCGEIRKISKVPILFISSSSDNMNMVTGLRQGADDFIAKPFDLSVFIAKVQALMRRSYDFTQTPGKTAALSSIGVSLDNSSMTLDYKGDKIELSKNEFRIIQSLMENPGSVVSRRAIMRKLWDSEYFIDENTLTVNINRLRKKLEAAGLTDFIATKKGEGYWIPLS